MISVARKKIDFNITNKLKFDIQNELTSTNSIETSRFFELHKSFMNEKALEGLRNRTLDDYQQHLKYFKKYINDNVTDFKNRIAVETFKSYVYWMSIEKKLSNFTVNARLRTLKVYLNWLYENKYINSNFSIKIKLLKVPKDTVKPLTKQEIRKMLEACDMSTYSGFRDYTLMILILDCGIRIGEASNLLISDVNFKQAILTVRGEVSKTNDIRYLPLSIKTLKLLKILIEFSAQMDSSYLFQSIYGGHIKERNLMLSFRRIGEKAGLKVRCTPYNFRHTFATNSVRNGMDLFTLQRIMGHKSLLTTRKYIQLETNDLKKKHAEINGLDYYFK